MTDTVYKEQEKKLLFLVQELGRPADETDDCVESCRSVEARKRLSESIGSLLEEFPSFSDVERRSPLILEKIIMEWNANQESEEDRRVQDIFRLVLQQSPAAASQTNKDGFLPIHVVINRVIMHSKFKNSLILQLLRYYPEALVQHPERFTNVFLGLSPLEASFTTIFPQSVRDEMMSYILPSSTTIYQDPKTTSIDRRRPVPSLVLTSFYLAQYNFGPPFSLEMAQVFGRLLPLQRKLTKFECHIRHWENEAAFLHLINCLGSHLSMKEIHLSVPVSLILANPRPVLECIQRFVHKLCGEGRLQKLCWVIPYGTTGMRSEDEDDLSEDTALLRAIHAGLTGSDENEHTMVTPTQPTAPCLEEMILENFVFMSFEAMRNILQSSQMPPRLDLVETVMGTRPFSTDNHDTPLSIEISTTPVFSCRIQDLEMTRCPVAKECLLPLLQMVSQMPNLQRIALELCNYRPGNEGPSLDTINLTPAIVSILENLSHLALLSISGKDIRVDDMEPICDVFKRNTTLRTYYVPASLDTEEKGGYLVEALKSCNTTLRTVETEKNTPAVAEIAYWIHLNRAGRGSLRREGATKTQLVRLLLQSTSEEQISTTKELIHGGFAISGPVTDGIVKMTGLHYGLLREMPNLWC